MSLVAAVLLAALVLGRLLGGSLGQLEALELSRTRLVVGALAVQAVGTIVGGPLFALGLAGSAVLVAAFLAANRGVRGTGLVALGLAANALVVGLNGAMPVSADAAARIGADPLALLDARHELAVSGTRLALLGDVVPVRMPLRPEVVSPGDVLVAAGLGQLLVLGMTGRSRAAGPGRSSGRSAGRPGMPAAPAAATVRPTPAPTDRPSRRPTAPGPPARRPSSSGPG